MKETVKFIIKKYGVGNLRYAIILYGSDAKVALSFERTFPSLENWLTTVDSMQNEAGNPALEKALQKAEELFKLRARKDAKKVLVVIADKSPIGDKQETGKEAQELEFADVKIVPVAIGGNIVPTEIEEISPYKDVLVVVPGEVDPTELGKSVMEKILKGSLPNTKVELLVCLGQKNQNQCNHFGQSQMTACERVAIGFGFTFDWMKKWREFFKPIVLRS